MDMRLWKKVLHQWITECDYIGNNHTSIEQSDIEAFFNAYIENLQIKDTPVQKKQTLTSFLKTYYPDFTPHFDENNAINLSDYVYVYSLLLHYSCVQNPQERFHNICRKLSGESQNCIAAFFKQVVESPVLTRDNLRQAFINVSNSPPVHSTPENRSASGDNNSIGELSLSTCSSQASEVGKSSKLTSYRSQLVSTPVRQLSADQRTSPSTPKTVMLESRTRELFTLRAQLETERYEKGMLELNIKQNEERIATLNNEKKTLQMELKELNQRSLACRVCESDVESAITDAEQVQKRLKKEINQKENEIAILMDNLRDVKEEKLAKEGKLKSAENQIDFCLKRIKELEVRVEELSAEVEQKNVAIQYLNNNKLELEQFITETRQAMNSRGTDLNTSADGFENSFETNSASSSPENLGYVIDKQLREKEHENENLLDQLRLVSESKLQFAQKLKALVGQQAQVYDLEIECGKQNEGDADELLSLVFQCTDLLGSNYFREYQNVIQLQDKINVLTSANEEMNDLMLSLGSELQSLKNTNHMHSTEILELNKQVNIKQQLLETLKEQLTESAIENKRIQSKNDKLKSDADFACQQNDALQKQLSSESQKHKEYALQTEEELVDMRKELVEKEQKMSELSSKVLELTNKNIELEELNKSFKNTHASELQEMKNRLSDKLQYITELERVSNHAQIAYIHINGKYQHCRGQLLGRDNFLEGILDVLKVNDLDEALQQIHSLVTFKQNTEEEIKIIKQCNEVMEREVMNVKNEYKLAVESNKAEIEGYTIQLRDAKEKMEQIENSYSEATQLHVSELAKLNEIIFDLKNERNDFSTKLAKIMEESDGLAQQSKQNKKDKQEIIAALNTKSEGLLKVIESITDENIDLLKRASDAEAVATERENDLQTAEDTVKKLQCDLKTTRSEHHRLQLKFQTTSTRYNSLCSDITLLRAIHQSVDDELKMKNCSARNADEKIKELMEQVDKLRMEKEALDSETKLLIEQVKANRNDQAISATKLKELNDKSQANERKSVNLENEIKAFRLEHDKLKNEYETAKDELNKQRELNVSLTKKLERVSVNLGEAQAKILQLQRKNAEHVSTINYKTTIVITLQRERDSLQAKIKSLDERLLKSERNVEIWSSRAQSAETTNRSLQEQRADAENMLVECKERNKKLENARLSQDENIRQLNAATSESENKIVQLTLEIGGLNSQLIDVKSQLNERNQLIESLNAKYDAAQQTLTSTLAEATRLKKQKEIFEKKYTEATHKLSMHNIRSERCSDELQQLRTEKDGIDALCDQLCATNHELKKSNAQLCNELAAIKEPSFTEQVEKQQIELEANLKLTSKLENEIVNLQTQINDYEQERQERELAIEILRKDLNEKETAIGVHQAEVMKLQAQIGDFKQELNEKQLTIAKLQADVDEKENNVAFYLSEMKEMSEAKESLLASYVDQVNSLQMELQDNADEMFQLRSALGKSASSESGGGDTTSNTDDEPGILLLRHERAIAQLRLDNQVLQAKYRDAKERIAEESKLSEERVKEQRLELEGKLEKMKAKMKVLYNEEITKMKAKQERDIAAIKEQCDQVQAQNKKYEDHTRKLSSQIVRLNDKLLEQQKQNALLITKLKHAEETQETMSLPTMQYKRTGTITTAPPQAVNLGTNLAMEDEEGEIFNNTYLTDLKSGRMPEITTEELQYRNSLLPPHLKSAYAAQYDVDANEDDIKDGLHSLDDSMSALLSTTNCPIRKKSCGTHYKRPGPPTPSKHGGRLSFGGSTEPPREILKESYDGGNAPSSGATSVKTPARFGFFASRFSLGSSNNAASTAGGGGSSHAGASSGLQTQNTRDERRKRNNNLLRRVQRRNIPALQRFIADATDSDGKIPFCTSTPRKSRTYYDQRRLINYSETSSASTPTEIIGNSSKDNKRATTNNGSTTTPLAIPELICVGDGAQYRRHTPHRSQTRVSIMYRRLQLQQASISGKKFSPQVRRLSHEICSSATTSSGGGDGDGAAAATCGQKQQASYRRRRRHTRTGTRPRPSLYIHGYIFAKPRRGVIGQRLHQQHGAPQREHFRAKSRNQRFDNFDQCRHLTNIEDTVDEYAEAEAIERDIEDGKQQNSISFVEQIDELFSELAIENGVGVVTNATYDLRNNNYSYDNLNEWRNNAGDKNDEKNFGATMVIVSHEKETLPPEFLRIENVDDGCGNATTALADTFDVCDDDNDDVLNGNENLWKLHNWAEQPLVSTADDAPANVKQFEQMVCNSDNTWLHPSTGAAPLKQRSRERLRQRLQNECNETDAALEDADENITGLKSDFEQVCKETVSNAPFAIKPLRYDDEYRVTTVHTDEGADDQCPEQVDARENRVDALSAIDDNNDPSSLSLAVAKYSNNSSNNNNNNDNTNMSTNTLMSSCCSNENSQKANQNKNNTTNASASSTLSHTIYPPHNLFDRRLPIINVTPVPSRKSETTIGAEDVGGILTTTNCLLDVSRQTITAADLIRMWHRMDTTARSIVGSVALAIVALCYSIVYILKQDVNAKEL